MFATSLYLPFEIYALLQRFARVVDLWWRRGRECLPGRRTGIDEFFHVDNHHCCIGVDIAFGGICRGIYRAEMGNEDGCTYESNREY
mmetsp:Transcript_5959/g.8678  ORF Transcript_5959/g.8678 Transcript_5959/m.8678 type:complete len:87 (+) Transcript_5959:315-575(+)